MSHTTGKSLFTSSKRSKQPLRHDAPVLARLARDWQLFGWAALLLGALVGVVVASWAEPRVSPEDGGLGILAGIIVGTVVWLGVALLRPRDLFIGKHYLHLDDELSRSVFRSIGEATAELRAGAERGHEQAAAALASLEQMRPDLEELSEERNRLASAIESADDHAHQRGYANALRARSSDLGRVMREIAMVSTAFAERVFLTRDDLLVPIDDGSQRKTLPELDLSGLTRQAQEALTAARSHHEPATEQIPSSALPAQQVRRSPTSVWPS